MHLCFSKQLPLPSQYTEIRGLTCKKSKNINISSLEDDGFLWTVVIYTPKSTAEIFLPSSNRKIGLEEGNKAILIVLENDAL